MKIYGVMTSDDAKIAISRELSERWFLLETGQPVTWENATVNTSFDGEPTDILMGSSPFTVIFSPAFRECLETFIIDEPIQWNPVTVVNNGVEYLYYALVFTRPLDELVCKEQSYEEYDFYWKTAFYPSKIKSYAIFYNPTIEDFYRYIVPEQVAREIKRRKLTGVEFVTDLGFVLAKE